MVEQLKLRKRQRLRQKEIEKLNQELFEILGIMPFLEGSIVDLASIDDMKVYVATGEIVGLIKEGKTFLTVKGLLRSHPEKKFVTVDMGAVQFVANGADVMSPGIVEVDKDIKKGDMVWIRDEKNKQPLAIGVALLSSTGMLASEKGKAVMTLHHVGDRIWNYDERRK